MSSPRTQFSLWPPPGNELLTKENDKENGSHPGEPEEVVQHDVPHFQQIWATSKGGPSKAIPIPVKDQQPVGLPGIDVKEAFADFPKFVEPTPSPPNSPNTLRHPTLNRGQQSPTANPGNADTTSEDPPPTTTASPEPEPESEPEDSDQLGLGSIPPIESLVPPDWAKRSGREDGMMQVDLDERTEDMPPIKDARFGTAYPANGHPKNGSGESTQPSQPDSTEPSERERTSDGEDSSNEDAQQSNLRPVYDPSVRSRSAAETSSSRERSYPRYLDRQQPYYEDVSEPRKPHTLSSSRPPAPDRPGYEYRNSFSGYPKASSSSRHGVSVPSTSRESGSEDVEDEGPESEEEGYNTGPSQRRAMSLQANGHSELPYPGHPPNATFLRYREQDYTDPGRHYYWKDSKSPPAKFVHYSRTMQTERRYMYANHREGSSGGEGDEEEGGGEQLDSSPPFDIRWRDPMGPGPEMMAGPSKPRKPPKVPKVPRTDGPKRKRRAAPTSEASGEERDGLDGDADAAAAPAEDEDENDEGKKGKTPRKKRKMGRFKCPEPWCKETFTRKNDVNRHLKNAKAHQPKDGPKDLGKTCQYCGADLSRTDAKVRHERVAACGKRAAMKGGTGLLQFKPPKTGEEYTLPDNPPERENGIGHGPQGRNADAVVL